MIKREFYKNNKSDKIWYVDEYKVVNGNILEILKGKYLFTFDKKNIFNFWTDYPDKLTPEQVEIFKKENPVMAELK